MKRYVQLAVLALVVVLGACGKKESEHTRSWYREHDAERVAMVRECKDDAAKGATPDCINAVSADSDIFINGKAFYRNGGGGAASTTSGEAGK